MKNPYTFQNTHTPAHTCSLSLWHSRKSDRNAHRNSQHCSHRQLTTPNSVEPLPPCPAHCTQNIGWHSCQQKNSPVRRRMLALLCHTLSLSLAQPRPNRWWVLSSIRWVSDLATLGPKTVASRLRNVTDVRALSKKFLIQFREVFQIFKKKNSEIQQKWIFSTASRRESFKYCIYLYITE